MKKIGTPVKRNSGQDEFTLTSNSPDDPRLKKGWGFVAALPSEYLIHFRKGKIHEKSSGQGAICFKLLRDTVFIIPTSLKEIIFQANQLTADNVDVRIRGMAVYRIYDPLKIYRLINFSNRQTAEEKLARMISDMCRSTAKWLVANMRVEECIRKRKEEIAAALKSEVSRVVSDNNSGWGVEIVTIDIQDVYIQDEEIFSALQMMYKTDKIRESKMAEIEMQRELELKQIESERSLGDHRKNRELEKARIQAEIKDEQTRLEKQNSEQRFALDRYRVEQQAAIDRYKWEQTAEQQRQSALLELEKKQKEIEGQKLAHEEELQSLERRIQIENSATPVGLEKTFIENTLPALGEVLGQNMRNVNMHIFQQEGKGGTPFNFVLSELLQIFRERMTHLGAGNK